jgi:type II secretory pathway component PulF
VTHDLRRSLLFASSERRLLLRRELLEALIAPIAAGAPLPEACLVASREHPSQPVRLALAQLARELASGRALSEALAGLEPLVDDMLVAAARTGERSGRMSDALASCERVLDARLAVARGVADAIAQPLLSLACAVAVVVLLLLVGAVRTILLVRDTATEAGSATAFLASHPFLAATAVLAIAIGAALALRAIPERWLGRLPLVGDLRRELSLGMLCRQVALLVESGTPLDEALASSLPIVSAGSATRAALEDAASRLRAGEPPARAAESLGPVPLVGAVLAAPNADGLAARLARVARWHEAETARLAEFAHALAASLSTALAGIACGAVVILAWSGYFEMATQFVN